MGGARRSTSGVRMEMGSNITPMSFTKGRQHGEVERRRPPHAHFPGLRFTSFFNRVTRHTNIASHVQIHVDEFRRKVVPIAEVFILLTISGRIR